MLWGGAVVKGYKPAAGKTSLYELQIFKSESVLFRTAQRVESASRSHRS
jgi:hypothetical protein